jgi:hypothetical protein
MAALSASISAATGTTKPERELRRHQCNPNFRASLRRPAPPNPKGNCDAQTRPGIPGLRLLRPAPPNPKGNCDSLLRLSCFPFRSGRPAPPNPKGNCDIDARRCCFDHVFLRPAPPNPKGNCDHAMRRSIPCLASRRPAPPNPKGNCDKTALAIAGLPLTGDRHHQTRKGIATRHVGRFVFVSAAGATGTTKPERELRPSFWCCASRRASLRPAPPNPKGNCDPICGAADVDEPAQRPAPPNPKGNCDMTAWALNSVPDIARPAPPNPKGNCDFFATVRGLLFTVLATGTTKPERELRPLPVGFGFVH